MSATLNDVTEKIARNARDKIYGIPTTDRNWEACKEFWMQPSELKWLADQLDKLKP